METLCALCFKCKCACVYVSMYDMKTYQLWVCVQNVTNYSNAMQTREQIVNVLPKKRINNKKHVNRIQCSSAKATI